MAQKEITVLPFSPEVLIVCNGGPDFVGIYLPEHLSKELKGPVDGDLTASIVDGVLTIQKSEK